MNIKPALLNIHKLLKEIIIPASEAYKVATLLDMIGNLHNSIKDEDEVHKGVTDSGTKTDGE